VFLATVPTALTVAQPAQCRLFRHPHHRLLIVITRSGDDVVTDTAPIEVAVAMRSAEVASIVLPADIYKTTTRDMLSADAVLSHAVTTVLAGATNILKNVVVENAAITIKSITK
jgi:hypothetical protein